MKALITGASSGIGLATAQQLLELGYQVSGIARDFSATELPDMQQYVMDLAKVAQLPEQFARLPNECDVLVLNAGYGRFGGLEQFSYAQIQHLLDTNLTSYLFLLKHYLPIMKQNGKGDIVIVGSESALQGAKAGSVYCATKFALRGLAQSLRADCATNDIRVMLINPGPVSSDFFDDLSFAPQEGEAFVIEPSSVAATIRHALQQPRNTVLDEINVQPIKRAFRKK